MDNLANLKDIHLPSAISWWPLAMGWYVIIGLVIFMSFFVLYKYYAWYKNKRFKRQALKILNTYCETYKEKKNTQEVCSHVSELLKQVALIYFARDEVASLQGDDWIHFLNRTSKKLDFNQVRHALLELPYQKSNEMIELEPLFHHVKLWIKQRGTSCLK